MLTKSKLKDFYPVNNKPVEVPLFPDEIQLLIYALNRLPGQGNDVAELINKLEVLTDN